MISRHYYDSAIDELYSEILYKIIHNVGSCDVGSETGHEAMLSYVQDAFGVTTDRHNQLLAHAEVKGPPAIMLNVEVAEAKELVPKNPNGLSNPFVTIYLVSNTKLRYDTSVKLDTLNPTWEEHFSLDFEPNETVKKKMGKIFDVKGVRGLRKFMKEIAVKASTGKHSNTLIGKVNIPLKAIPANGMTMWYSLDKKNRLQRQGVVKVQLNFSSEKNSEVAAQEHRHLLRVLLLHELERSRVARYWWCGNFSTQAENIISQHVSQSGLGVIDKYLSQWAVFCDIMTKHPLSFTLFNDLLEKLIKPLQSGSIGQENINMFWDGARKLLPICFDLIIKKRKKLGGNKTLIKKLKEVLKILNHLSALDVPEGLDLFPMSMYGWMERSESGSRLSIHEVLYQSATRGASVWFVHLLDNNVIEDSSEEDELQHIIRVIQLVRSDLQRAVEHYDKIFVCTMDFSYAKSLYGMYEARVASLLEPKVVQVCRNLKHLRYEDEDGWQFVGTPPTSEELFAKGTKLFELYLTLQSFLRLGQDLNKTEWQSYQVTKFHSWFLSGVSHWCDIAVYKALKLINRAIELDSLEPLDENTKYSSSGVYTLGILNQIKFDWQQLAWPDVETSYAFIAKIVYDICQCCVFYADNMAGRISDLGFSSIFNKFEVTSEWCLAINSIDYVRQRLRPFVDQLGLDEIIQKMYELKSPIEALRCKETLQNILENAIDIIENKIFEILEKMVKNMMPSITSFLVESADMMNNDSSSIDRVMLYLEANLNTLYCNLNSENFLCTLDITWAQISELLHELIKLNRAKRRPPHFFSNLHTCLNAMVRSFQQDSNEVYSNEKLKRVECLLQLHGMATENLIHQVHMERWKDQQTLTEPRYGMVTVRAQFLEQSLMLEILNARSLVPMNSNGLCNSYVRVALLPEHIFAATVKPKTKTYKKNLFPLYEEVFEIPLTAEQLAFKDGLLQLVVKDKDLFSVSNQCMGEVYLHFSEIPATSAPLSSLPQVHLTLTRSTKIEGDTIDALESRQGDRLARDFLKKQKQMYIATN